MNEERQRVPRIKGWILIALLILIELVFRIDARTGFYFYAVFLVLSIFYLIYAHMDDYLTFLLIIPVIRICSTTFDLGYAMGALFTGFVMLIMILVKINFSEHRLVLFGFSTAPLKRIVGKRLYWVLMLFSIGTGAGIGIWIRSSATPMEFSDFLLFSVLFASAVEELYFRGVLMTLDKSIRTALMLPFLYAVLAFNGSIIFFAACLVFSLAASLMFYKYRTIYLPLLTHLVISVILVIP